jgi:hypothetical protein
MSSGLGPHLLAAAGYRGLSVPTNGTWLGQNQKMLFPHMKGSYDRQTTKGCCRVKDLGFFVMIRHPRGHPMVMVDEEEDVKLFQTREQAEDAGKKNFFGETFGFEVYEWEL